MQIENWQQVKEIFNRAVELDATARAAYLTSLGDKTLRREVEKLIAADAEAQTFPNIFSAGGDLSTPDVSPSFVNKQIGPYKIIRELGSGGMGAVFLAARQDLKKQVALKIVKHEFSSMTLFSRFQNEREILAALEHPNIAHLLDSGTTDAGLPYFVMEYVEGEDLLTFARRNNLSINEKLKLFRKVCEAVAYAHSRLVVHRDLKPSNILVNEKGEPKLLDFGISKLLTEAESQEKGTITAYGILTPHYASPEQFRGETVSTATDVYSLGVILYELLTDTLPYEVTNRRFDEVARIVCETAPRRPSDVSTRERSDENTDRKSRNSTSRFLRGDLDNILLKSLRKEPSRRYSSVEQFAEDLRRHVAGLPVVARPDTFGYRAEKFIKRNFLPLTSAALVFLMLVAGIAGISWQYVRAESQRKLAETRFKEVRELANSFVFKYHDEIQNLPGSTRLREMLVKDALVYLDRLAAVETDDRSLKIELAQAYMKIGDVQGQAYDANLGDTAGAIESYRKAIALLETANDSADVNIANELVTAYQKFSSLLARGGDSQSAVYAEKSVALSEKTLAAQPENNEQILRLAGAYLYLGDSLVSEYEAERIIEVYQKALVLTDKVFQAEPNNPLALRRTIGLNQRLGFQYFLQALHSIQIGKPELAVAFYEQSHPFYRRSLETAEKQFALDPQNSIFRRTLFAVKLNLSQVERELGATEKALQEQKEVLAEFQKVMAADAENFEAKSDVALALDDLALTYARRGEFSAAFENFRRAVKLLDEAIGNDSKNKEFWRSRRDVNIRYADALAESGNLEQATETYKFAFEQIKAAPMLTDAAWQNFYAGELYEKLGDVNAKLAAGKDISAAERVKYAKAAESDYQKAIEFWRNPECWKKNFSVNSVRFDYVAQKLVNFQA